MYGQVRTLLHESYRAAKRDLVDASDDPYDYANCVVEKLAELCPGLTLPQTHPKYRPGRQRRNPGADLYVDRWPAP